MSREVFLQNIEKAQLEINKQKEMVKSAKMRQHYHFMAEEGWINDPNGLIYFKGKYHFFYQYNPYDSYWGAMHWGHAISDDMLHWEYLPIALAPSEHYDNHKEGGCFSGSAIADGDRLYLIYTGTTNYGDGFIQTQNLAYSDDGVHFKKYELNPIITAPEGFDPANFRDPKVWKHGKLYYLLCGSKKDNLAQALIFKSTDLKQWEFLNVLAESRGDLGYMWECPDFYPLGDKFVLMFSPMGVHERTTVYLVGDFNYETGKFNYTVNGDIDWGFDFYAPQSFLDNKGRRLIVGWANAWDWMPWWKDWGPTFKEGWCGSFNLVREVKLCEDNTLQIVPAEEYETLRYGQIREENIIVSENLYQIETADGVSCELEMLIDLKESSAEEFMIILRSDGKNETIATFDLKHQMLYIDRNNADNWSNGITKSTLNLLDKNQLEIRIYIDQSSIELFTDDYKTVHSLNVFASSQQSKNYIKVNKGMIKIKKIITYGLKRTM